MKPKKIFDDNNSTISDLKGLVRNFIEEREWSRYHTPKNVAVSIAIEASELLEHFQWRNPNPREINKGDRKKISEEMSDVLAYLLSLSIVLGIDISKSLQEKIKKNCIKYPVERFHGNWEKVTK